ncbi:unnamed protein product [Amoebophrya sp. A25]|nr:unnamed protein product [Amoebophrya sp. A25]|eukprot:GSA25T00017785001.1
MVVGLLHDNDTEPLGDVLPLPKWTGELAAHADEEAQRAAEAVADGPGMVLGSMDLAAKMPSLEQLQKMSLVELHALLKDMAITRPRAVGTRAELVTYLNSGEVPQPLNLDALASLGRGDFASLTRLQLEAVALATGVVVSRETQATKPAPVALLYGLGLDGGKLPQRVWSGKNYTPKGLRVVGLFSLLGSALISAETLQEGLLEASTSPRFDGRRCFQLQGGAEEVRALLFLL